jgi:hypothetical protein
MLSAKFSLILEELIFKVMDMIIPSMDLYLFKLATEQINDRS